MQESLPAQEPEYGRALCDRWGTALLVAVAVLSALSLAVASLRHTGSLAFPIDDGYIYSNYVLSASQGHFFEYNIGETSGGITGLGWYLLCLLSYWLLSPFHVPLGMMGPPTFAHDAQAAQLAGHLYLAAYLPGVLCLAATALGVHRLALHGLPTSPVNWRAHSLFCWLLGVVAAVDLGLVWGAMSGLEVPLASALAVWSVYLLLADVRRGCLRWSLLMVALLPWARPDLLAISGACVLWMLVRVLVASDRRQALRQAAILLAACLFGLAAMSLIYYLGWGKPLPGSFYAKVGGLRLGERFFSAAKELWISGRALPFIAGAAALAGGLLTCFAPNKDTSRDTRLSALLLLLVSASYVAAIMATLPWFGQEDRYLLPVHPFVIVLTGMLIWAVIRRVSIDVLLARVNFLRVGIGLAALLLVGANYLWATRNYVVQVRNIDDAHLKPARWLAQNAPPDALVAAEPIGAVKLFSGRRTLDLVGLTTPATLGTYRNWPLAWQKLNEAGAAYLLYYPAWFDGGRPPPWAIERARMQIPDNRIAGDDVIAVYELDWSQYTGP